MYLCIDFDGTMVDHTFPNVGAPVPNAVEWVKLFQTKGADIILLTVRCDSFERKHLQEAVSYMTGNDITLFGINDNPAQKDFSLSPKAWGHIYIDDAAFGCPLILPEGFGRPCVDWNKVGPAVLSKI